MAANMILDTSHNTQQVKKMVCKSFKLHIGAKIDHFLNFSCCVYRNFSFWRFTRKRMGLELRVVISANIKSTIAVILQKKLSLYDLQKPRYDFVFSRKIARDKNAIFAINAALTNYATNFFGFSTLKIGQNRRET